MSDDKKELDNYGVWVKKPPVDSDSSTDSTELDTELPDFSEITDSAAAGGEEEISLDEFIDGGVFEGDEPKSEEPVSTPAPAESPAEESISLSEFGLDDSPADEAAAPAIEEAPLAGGEDQPLDIDLSFDDGETAAENAPENNQVQQSDSNMESIDLSDFGFDDGEAADTPAPAAESSNAQTEDVDLSEFGFEDSDADSPAGAEPEPAEAVSDQGSMENVDLSEFGFDEAGESTESPDAKKEPVAEEKADDIEFSVGLDDEENTAAMPAIEESVSEADTETAISEESAEEPVFEEAAAEAEAEEVSVAEPAPAAAEKAEPAPAAAAPAEKDDVSAAAATILSQLVGELHSLKDEIASLKSDLESIRNQRQETAPAQPLEPAAAFSPSSSDAHSGTKAEEAVPFAEEDDVLPDFSAEQEAPSAPFAEDDDIVPETAGIAGEPVEEEEPEQEAAEAAPAAEETAVEESAAVEEPEVSETAAAAEETVAEEPAVAEEEELAEEAAAEELAEEETDGIAEEAETAEEAAAELTEERPAAEEAEALTEEAAVSDAFEEPALTDFGAENTESAEIPVPATEENTGGFFGDDDGDETISLSLDELGNILNSADFTESPAEEEVSEPAVAEADAVPEEAAPEESEAVTEDTESESDSFSVLGTVDEAVEDSEQEFAQDAAPQMDFANEGLEEPVFTEPEAKDAEPVPEEIEIPLPAAPDSDTIEDVIVDAEGEEEQLPAEAEAPALSADDLLYLNSEPTPAPEHTAPAASSTGSIPSDLRQEIKSVLSYMDQLLENLPEEKIAEFAQSDQFETYKKLFKELGLA